MAHLDAARNLDLRLAALANTLPRLPRASHLTTVHAEFMRVATGRNAFASARMVADLPMTSLATLADGGKELGPVTASDVLTYYFCAGMMFCELREWERAAAAFKMVRAAV